MSKSNAGYKPANNWSENNGNGWGRPHSFHVVKEGKILHPMLRALLSQPTAHGLEDRVRKMLPDDPDKKLGKYIDGMGNVFFNIGHMKKHRTMFSCHMDTVHGEKCEEIIPIYDDNGFIYGSRAGKVDLEDPKHNTYVPEILGSDDKLGMFIMLYMMHNKVPGLYAFHVGEEKGGLGSSFAVKSEYVKKVTRNIDRCIAFDRMHYCDIITHQRGDRCCSKEFAEGLASQLNGMEEFPPAMRKWHPDPTGSFTDSANYTDLVPECTNLSIGYFHQHTANEHFDYVWLNNHLLPALMKVKWDALPTVRKKGWSEKLDTDKYGCMCAADNRDKHDAALRIQREEERKNAPAYTPYKMRMEAIHKATSWSALRAVSIEELLEVAKSGKAIPEGVPLCLTKQFALNGAEDMALMFQDLMKVVGDQDKEIKATTEALKNAITNKSTQEVARLEWSLEVAELGAATAWEEADRARLRLLDVEKRNTELALENKELKEQMANRSVTVMLKKGA